jgi:sialate O-acetylesterase
MKKTNHNFILISFLVLLANTAFANVKLASIFSDHMVLQADKTIVVWGTADIAELVTVEINGFKAISRTTINRKWKVELPAMKYGGPYELKVSGDNIVVLKNVMIGEVWLCAGQSNMRMTVKGVSNAKEEMAQADYKNIRFLTIPNSGNTEPQNTVNASWEVCSPKSIASKTAVGYFFGRELNTELNVAIGLIDVSYGGATIFTFMDESTVEKTIDTATFNGVQKQRWDAYKARVENWEINDRHNKRPSFSPQHFSTLCYNAMVHPIVPFANRGAIWYQGESNASEPEKYVTWFGDYISMMREKFNNAEMPLYFVQLAGFENQLPPETWAKFRLGQEQCMKYPNTGMAAALDIGMKDNIHPKNKQEVGRRLALNALNQTYGKTDVAYRGPQLKFIYQKERQDFNTDL